MSKAPKKIYVKEFDEGISQTWSSTRAKKTTAIIQHEYIRKDAATEALSLPANLDEAAQKVEDYYDVGEEHGYLYCHRGDIKDVFKAGAEWMNKQMKMPNSTELISEWHNVKTILEEKDFRGDEWRLAYNAFMFGFSRGINTNEK